MQIKNFTKIIQDQTGGNHKIKKEDYSNSGDFPIIDQGQQFIGGYTNEKGLLCKVELPCIIFGDHTRIFKYVDFPFAMGADGVKVLKCNDELDTKYAYFFLKQTKLGGKQGYNRNFKYLKEVNIPLPPLATQRTIADKLDKLQFLIDLKKQSITKTNELAKSIFLEMFGDPMKNEKGREVKKLKDFGEIKTGNTPSRKHEEYYGNYIERIKSDNINTPNMFLTNAEEGLSELGKEYGRTVPAGSVLVTCIAGSLSCIGNVAIADKEVAFNQQINAIIPNALTNSYYLYALIENAKKYIQDHSTNSMKGMLSKGKMELISFPLPPLPLQQKFADIITQIEVQKSEHKLALAKLEELYQAEMQRSFRL